MLEQIRKLAMEKLASEDEVNAFMEGFEKEASISSIYNAFNTYGTLGKDSTTFVNGNNLKDFAGKAAVGLGAALLGAAIVKGVSSGANLADKYSLRHKFDLALAQVISTNKIVRGYKPERIKEYAETLFKFAPHVSSDPNLLGYNLANVLQGEGIDVMTIKLLVDLEGRYIDNSRTQPLPGIRI